MNFDQFIDRVKDHAELKSREEAVRATEATLETLGERLEKGGKHRLSAQLPNELKRYLLKRTHDYNFLLEEFYNRVSKRGEIGYPHAVKLSRAVMAVLKEAVSEAELEDVFSELPSDYDELLGKEPKDPLSPTREP